MGGWILGGFIGLVFSLKLIGLSVTRTQTDYEVHKSSCFSCGRCCSYCPSDEMHLPNFVPGTQAYIEAMALRDPEAGEDDAKAAEKAGKELAEV